MWNKTNNLFSTKDVASCEPASKQIICVIERQIVGPIICDLSNLNVFKSLTLRLHVFLAHALNFQLRRRLFFRYLTTKVHATLSSALSCNNLPLQER